MRTRKNTVTCVWIVICLCCLLVVCGASSGMDRMVLADICQAAENAIGDFSVEYEWARVPSVRAGDVVGPKSGLWSVAPSRCTLIARQPFFESFRFVQKEVFVNNLGQYHEETNHTSYDGNICKSLKEATFPAQEGRASDKPLLGSVAREKPSEPIVNVSPLGFTPLRLCNRKPNWEPLSEALRRENLAILDSTPQRVNGFNAIRADLLLERDRKPYIKAYFSIDHDYTLVRYEFVSGPKDKVYLTIDVNSLEKVGNGLWFPSSGTIWDTDPNSVANTYRATSPIRVNQQLPDEAFDIVFPPGTRVADSVTLREYNVRPTQEQLDESLPK